MTTQPEEINQKMFAKYEGPKRYGISSSTSNKTKVPPKK